MKRTMLMLLLSAALLTGCGNDEPKVVKTYSASESNVVRSYSELDDGTWKCGDAIYSDRVTVSGTFGTTGGTVTLTVLTNDPNVTYDDVSGTMLSIGGETSADKPVVVEMQ